ncbi:MAG: FAD-dependent oxidoreductase [Pseudomonadales bacterium]
MHRIIRFEDVSEFDISTGVIVAGYGGAGASAAWEAKQAGSDVLVLECSSAGGGSTRLSACEMYLGGSGGTRLQRDLGIEDSSENFYNYLLACFGPYADEARVRAFVDGAAEHFDWCEALGVPYKRGFFSGRDVVAMTGDSLQFTGNERAWPFTDAAAPVPRGHLPADADHNGGHVFMDVLMQRVEQKGVDIRVDARVTALIQDTSGGIRGLVAKIDNTTVFCEAQQGVVLTMGGFIMNEQMTKRHIPYLDSVATRHGNPGDMGDGILLGVAAGGQAINMGEAFVGLAYYPPAELTYGIFVNSSGQRFINEDVYLGRIGYYAAQQPEGKAYMFIDNKYFSRPAYHETTEIVAVGETVAEVEKDAGLPPSALQQTVSYYNEFAAKGEDPQFHKATEWLEPFATPPYALISYSLAQLRPTVFTLGGLDVLPTGDVLSPNREAVARLYAAGRTVAGIPRTSKGYASGMSVADATYFGRLAGQQVAKQNRC